MGLLSGILKLVNPSVDEVVGRINKLQQGWAEDVMKPIQDMVTRVEKGGIWEGAGAELFVQECRSTFLPESESIIDRFRRKVEGINSARDIINEADRTAAQVADQFAELAEKIYHGT